MSIRPIDKKVISNEILEQMKQNIMSGEWAPGSKIPGEMELTRIFGVSRISVRQAIHQLVGAGVLTVRRGDGTYVTNSAKIDFLLPMLSSDPPELQEVLELRMILETENARLAAQRATDRDIALLRSITDEMARHKNELEAFSTHDLDFHFGIAAVTKNRLALKIQTVIHDVLDASMKEAVMTVGYDAGVYYHNRIIDALEAKDPDAAADFMRRHIQNVTNTLNQGEKQQKKGE